MRRTQRGEIGVQGWGHHMQDALAGETFGKEFWLGVYKIPATVPGKRRRRAGAKPLLAFAQGANDRRSSFPSGRSPGLSREKTDSSSTAT